MKVLILGAHPDDAEIGCGGLIAKSVSAGHEVFVVFMTQGELGCPGLEPEQVGPVRVHEAFEASKVLGSIVAEYWDEPDSGLVYSENVLHKLVRTMNTLKPDIAYIPHSHDGHSDHRAVNQIFRSFMEKGLFRPSAVYEYEIWTPMDSFTQALDITEEIGKKLIAIRRHESQVARIRFDEAALALARFRGELHNRPHGPYAEVYNKLNI